MVKVELRNITRKYVPAAEASEEEKRRPALANVSMTIADGEIVSIVGPSGCGKSTLLKIIAGLEFADDGQVLYNDYDVTRVEPGQRGIGMVFQDYALYPTMKGKGNLAYYFEVHQRTEAEMEQRTREVAAIMGVGFELLTAQKTDTLSGGEQQRVAIGRCIVRDPHVFLMDEPISNLDAKLRERTRIEIKKMLRKFDVTTVYVTHDQQEAIFMGDRIAVMRTGKLEQIGSYDDLYYTPANLFVATFIGTPPMNVVPLKCAVDTLVLQGTTHAAVDQIIWTVPSHIAATFGGRTRVRLGVRAEGWEVDHPKGVPFPVRYIERIPTEQAAYLHGALEGVSVTILVPLDFPDTSNVRVMPKWDAAYFFDEKEETALHTPGLPDLDLF